MDSEFDTLSARYSPASSNKLTGFKAKQKFKIKNQTPQRFVFDKRDTSPFGHTPVNYLLNKLFIYDNK